MFAGRPSVPSLLHDRRASPRQGRPATLSLSASALIGADLRPASAGRFFFRAGGVHASSVFFCPLAVIATACDKVGERRNG